MKAILYFVIPSLFLLGLIGIGITMYRASETNQATIDAAGAPVR